MTSALHTAVTVRRARPADHDAILELIGMALVGEPGQPGIDELFAWKHLTNPFGQSPAWVALDGERIVGFRTFMRWRFSTPTGPVPAVRAVDTATHPDYQGRGIFSQLTQHALAELRAEGVGFVFNTPNDKSGPGYLKMGWQPVGRLPTGLLPGSVRGLPRIASARVPAQRWSTPNSAGAPAPDVLADHAGVSALLAALPAQHGIGTERTASYLQWRYGLDRLAYRAVLAGSRVEDGLVLFRTRRRGAALELSVGDVLLPRPSAWLAARLIREALRRSGADYALGLRCLPQHGLLPLPGQGPMLMWRALARETAPELDSWRLSLGDVELF
jgi:GNAT superfamily N-acetyltransferase